MFTVNVEKSMHRLSDVVMRTGHVMQNLLNRSLASPLFKSSKQFKRQIASCGRINAFHLNLHSRGVRPKDVSRREGKR